MTKQRRRQLVIIASVPAVLFALALGTVSIIKHTGAHLREQHVARLLERLSSPDVELRRAAAEELDTLDPTAEAIVPALIEALGDGDLQVRSAISEILRQAGGRAVPQLVALVEDPAANPATLAEAAWTLGNIGRRAESAAPALVGLLCHPADPVRVNASWALGMIEQQSVEAVSGLRGAVGDSNPDVRRNAVWALGKIGPRAGPAAPELVQAMHGDDAEIRSAAVVALGRIGEAAAEATDSLVAMLQDPDNRLPAVDALSRIGPAAGSAVPSLVENLGKGMNLSYWPTVAALNSIGCEPEDALPAFVRVLKNSDDSFEREHAARTLGSFKSQARDAVPALTDALQDPHHAVRETAANALGRIGPAAFTAVPALQAALGDDATKVRRAAKEALDLIQKP